MLVAGLNLYIINVTNAIFIASNIPRLTLILTVPMVPLALIGHLFLTPRLGGIGASFVTAFIACLGAVVSLVAVYQVWKIYPPVKTILRSIFCSLLVFVLASLWPASGFMLILKLSIITLVIPSSLLIIGEFTSSEKDLFCSIILRKFRLNQNKSNSC
ncbi:membrane hypothetical protein [Candidatus Magnetomoraceae bacterium gMMP-15]